MKIAVYTIALNEAAHAERWADSAVDADYRIVADTGSTDDTVERLAKAGVTVHRIAVRPWRFDVARNTAMAIIPADVDVCCTMDMDRFLEPGWRQKLEEAWTLGTTALYSRVVYRASADDPVILRGWPSKSFHHRWGYRFTRPVHEALSYAGQEVTRDCLDIVMCEVQDHNKETRRQYLPLMELAHKEDPNDAQICFWLGRDYMWADRHDEGSMLLQRYLELPTSTWTEERSEAMRYLARMQPDRKLFWLEKARHEAPQRREIWLDLAEDLHGKADWSNLFWACANGIEKTRRTGSYLDDAHSWGFRLFELGAIAAWHLKAMDRAVEWSQKALEFDPGNQRLRDILYFFARLRTTPSFEASKASAGVASYSEDEWRIKLLEARSLRELNDEDGFVRIAREAFLMRPHRPEPLHDLATFYLGTKRGDLAAYYAEAAASLPRPTGDTLLIDDYLYNVGLRHSFSAAANWTRDGERKERGRKVCDWLALSHDTPEDLRKIARYNSGWYAAPLASLLPSLSYRPLSIETPDGLHPANVGICRRGHGFALTVRAVNYVLSGGFHFKGSDPSYRSRMLLLSVDPDLTVVDSAEVELPSNLPTCSTETLGFEDPRPFLWRDSLWCVSSVRQLNAEARPEMVLARIDESFPNRPSLTDWRVLSSGMPQRWEKNWMPQVRGDEISFVYSLDPTRVLTDGGSELINETAPIAAETFFGGSQAVSFDGGWLMVIHEFEWVDRKRRYFHRFVWLDKGNHLWRLSRRFYLHAAGYEFVAGMAWHTDERRLVITFSQNDSDPFFAVFDAAELRGVLLDIAEHERAADEALRAGAAIVGELIAPRGGSTSAPDQH